MATESTLNLDLVEELDSWSYLQKYPAACREMMKDYYAFMVAGYSKPFGYMPKVKVEQMIWPEDWDVDPERLVLLLNSSGDLEERTALVREILELNSKARTPNEDPRDGIEGEMFPVYGPDGELVLSIPRSASDLFRIETYGVFLIAYTQMTGERKFWVAKRSMSKATYPGMLDMCVGGSLKTNESAIECLVREAEEKG